MSRIPKPGNLIWFGFSAKSRRRVRKFDERDNGASLRDSRRQIRMKLSPYRFFMVSLQIAAVAFLLAASLRADASSMGIVDFGDRAIATPGPASCYALEGEKVPAHGRQEHIQCCIFCSAASRDFPALFLGYVFSLAYDLATATRSYVVYPIANQPGPLDFGWASAWSSRAPPLSL